MKLNLTIITQEEHLLTEKVEKVAVPAVMGEVTILPQHIPMFTRLNDGIIKIFRKDGTEEFAVLGGFMDVGPNNTVTIMADSAIRAADVNEAKAEEARQRAEEAMQNKQSDVEFRVAENSLRRAMLELKVARRRKARQTLQGE